MILARLTLLAAVSFAVPAVAADVIADMAPPPPRNESMGHPRDGYIWAPGHWDWNGHAYRWTAGSWIVEHGKAHWIADRWEPFGNQWRYVAGHWEH